MIPATSDRSMARETSAKRFRVALSFANAKREFVAQVAAALAARFTESAILYDKYHVAEFARPDLNFYLPKLYREQSDPDRRRGRPLTSDRIGVDWNGPRSMI